MILTIAGGVFLNASFDLKTAMVGYYEYDLVFLSILVSVLASGATLNVVERIRNNNKMLKERTWLFIGIFTMSLGVWAMHFIGMLAYQMHMPVTYDLNITLASLLPVILACGYALFIITRANCTVKKVIIAGIFMGLGVGIMHYTGMMAMRMNAVMRFEPVMFVFSAIISVVLAIVALYVNWWFSKKNIGGLLLRETIVVALVMGLAVSGMHYTGMYSTYMFPTETITAVDVIDPDELSIWVALASLFITLTSVIMTVIEKRMATAAGTATISRAQLIEAIDYISDGFVLYDTDDKLLLINNKYLQMMQLGNRESVMGETSLVINQKIITNHIFIEYQSVTEQQSQTRQLSNGSWLRISDHHVAGIGHVTTFTDITEIQATQVELAKVNEKNTVLNKRLNVENRRLGAEVDVASQIQHMVLPKTSELQQLPGLDISAYMKSADEVGGDYYDVLQHNGHIKIGIGDVTGHGLESGVLMLMTQMGVRTLLTSEEFDPTRFFSILNKVLYDNTERMGIDKSLTLLLLDYIPATSTDPTGKIKVCGQHEELLVVRQNGEVVRIDTLELGFPIAMVEDITDFIQHKDIELNPGDGLVLYTDGITEAENTDGIQYEIDKLCTVISRHWASSAEAIKSAIIEDVKQHIGDHTVYDDITLMVIKQKPLAILEQVKSLT